MVDGTLDPLAPLLESQADRKVHRTTTGPHGGHGLFQVMAHRVPAQGGESQRRKRRSLGPQSNARPRDSSSRLMSGARPGGSAGSTDPVTTPALHGSSHFVFTRVWARD